MDKYFDGELLSGFEESPKTTTSRYEQLGYCEYRDVKTGLVASNYIEVMNQQSNRIADLEAKLSKSDMEVFMLTKNNDCYKSDIAKLKQQLADKDEEIKQLKFQSAVDEDWSITHRTIITELEDELNEVESFMKNYGFDSLDELKEYYVNLLELKDWLYDRIDGTESDNGIYTEFHSGQCNAYCKVLDKLDELYNPNQNQTAIAELEKVFRDFNHKIDDEFADNDMKYITLDIEDVNFYLQDKIKSLKGEK